jgi:AcrR family transcriptional regulator
MASLPKGRHGLSREQVEASQRTRLLRATVELGSERGLASLTLTDIVGRAGVARSTFYEHFADKQQCFLETFDYAAERLFERVLAIEPIGAEQYATVAHFYIAQMLELCLEEPGLVHMVAGDAEALGPAAAERQRQIRTRLADGLVGVREFLRASDPSMTPITQLRGIAIVGAIGEVLQHTLATAGLEAVPALQAELSTIMLALTGAPAA